MFPDRCAITRNKKQCPNPPTHVVSVKHQTDEYMVGVTCEEHKHIVSGKIHQLQQEKVIPTGTVSFTKLKSVGTDCIRMDPDNIINIDGVGMA